ncbi:MAG: hypothetical protein J2P50_20910, partial [Hyphomicrobiaceae bacterium]|nr:hypothetical protein [Hyphomicrobiaceae bacterium]
GGGKWAVKQERDPIDDAERVVFFLQADEGQPRSLGATLDFIVRCRKGQVEVFLDYSAYLGLGRPSVTFRIGDAKPVTQVWNASGSYRAAFAPQPQQLLRQLFASNRFVAQLTPYNEQPLPAVFDTAGLKTLLERHSQTCGWSAAPAQEAGQ